MRVLAMSLVFLLAPATGASAALVYRQPATGAIVAARDDGSKPRTIAHGRAPAVSPDGRYVAFRTSSGAVRLVGIGGGRSRLLLQHGAEADRAVAWSSDHRHLVASAADRRGAWLIDIVKRRRRFIPVKDEPGRATFSPNGLVVLVEDTSLDGDPYLAETRLGSKTVKHVSGAYGLPEWGRLGLAFLNSDATRQNTGSFREVIFRQTLAGAARSLLRTPPETLLPVAWSGDGHRLLVEQGDPGDATTVHAVLLDAFTGGTQTLAPALSTIEGLSRDGRHVLGEVAGNVISVDLAGNVTVLARGATSPSWTSGAYL